MKQTTKAQKYRKIKFEVIYVVKGYGFGSFSISIFEAITLQVERSSSKIFRTVFTSLPCVTIFSATSPYICQIWLLKQILHYFKISHLYLTRTCEVKSFFLVFPEQIYAQKFAQQTLQYVCTLQNETFANRR